MFIAESALRSRLFENDLFPLLLGDTELLVAPTDAVSWLLQFWTQQEENTLMDVISRASSAVQ
jgi:hypothetical protein